MSDYADDIRRIAKKDKQKGGLSAKGERDPIFGTTTPFAEDALSKETTGNERIAEDACESDEKPAEPIDPNDPNTFKQPLPGSGDGDNTPEYDDLVDNLPTFNDDPTGGDYPTGGYGSLNGIDGLYDCGTDAKIDVRFDGRFPDQSGWDDPETPPLDDTWEIDTYWKTTPQGWAASTMWQTYALWAEATKDAFGVGNTKLFQPVQVDNDLWTFRAERISPPPTHIGWFEQPCSRLNCLPTDGAKCDVTEAPNLTECWDSDDGGVTSVARIDGVYRTSEHDCNSSAFEERSDVTLCAGTGGQKPVRFQAGSQGREIISFDNGTTMIRDKNGKPEAYGDTTTTFIAPYLP